MAPPSGPTTLCLACFSSIHASSSSSTRPPFRTPCCSRPVCARCLDAKPRLAAYCLHCQNPIDIVSAPAQAAEKRIGATEKWMGERASQEEAHNFVIGEDEGDQDEDDDMARRSPPSVGETEDMTPDYEATVQEMASQLPLVPGDDPPAYDYPYSPPGGKADPNDEKASMRPMREGGLAIHYLRYPHDTLAGLALKYKVDGRHLALINHLPPSTLTTTPSLLYTRPFILLPPHIDPAASSSPIPLLSPEEQRLRQLIRRFQLQTKVADWNVARAYIEVVLAGRRAEAAGLASGDNAAEAAVRSGGEVEEACANWRTDEEWERRDKGKATATASRPGGLGPWTRGERGVAVASG